MHPLANLLEPTQIQLVQHGTVHAFLGSRVSNQSIHHINDTLSLITTYVIVNYVVLAACTMQKKVRQLPTFDLYGEGPLLTITGEFSPLQHGESSILHAIARNYPYFDTLRYR